MKIGLEPQRPVFSAFNELHWTGAAVTAAFDFLVEMRAIMVALICAEIAWSSGSAAPGTVYTLNTTDLNGAAVCGLELTQK